MTYFIPNHRHVEDTPEAHKSFCYQFLPDGVGIRDDLGGPLEFVTDPYTVDFHPAAVVDGAIVVGGDQPVLINPVMAF